MNRHLSTIALTAAAFAVAACSDTATSPVADASRGISPFSAAFDNAATPPGQSADFTLTSAGGTFTVLGRYKLTFPPNSVCDPAVSTYGPTEWDAPCQTLDDVSSVNVHAVLSSATGLAVDFSPELRFSPGTVVTISTDMFAAFLKSNAKLFRVQPATLNFLTIYYTAFLGGPRALDFVSDPSVITHVDLSTGSVWRRIKHFSGYYMSSGQACTPSPDVPECVQVDGIMDQ